MYLCSPFFGVGKEGLGGRKKESSKEEMKQKESLRTKRHREMDV